MMRLYSNEKIIGISVMIRLEAYSGDMTSSLIYTSRKVHRQKRKHTMSLYLIWLIDKSVGGQFPQTRQTFLHTGLLQMKLKLNQNLGMLNCVYNPARGTHIIGSTRSFVKKLYSS